MGIACSLDPDSLNHPRLSLLNLILYSSSWIPRPQLVAFASRRIYGLTTTSRFAYQSAHFPTTKPTATAFNHFITMAGKRLRCNAKECREPAQRVVGDCGFCNGHFCGKHRLLEDHKCSGLEDCKKQSHERNAAQLESERTQVIRGVWRTALHNHHTCKHGCATSRMWSDPGRSF